MGSISQLFSIGADYQITPATVREMISMSADTVAARLRQLADGRVAQEAAIVSTCNRTEIYCLTDRPEAVSRWLAGDSGSALFQLRAEAAVRRVFSVASGLESQIIGEPEITGQVKRAAQIARDSGASGVFINRLLEKSLAAAKEVRHRTDICRHSLSYCGLVARAAVGIFPDFADTAVLFVGSGDITRAGVPLFAGRGVRRIAVANRSMEKAVAVAAPSAGEAFPLSRLSDILGEFDIVISATSSPLPVIGKGTVERALHRRRRRPMVFADLGVPHNLEPEIAALPDVFVYTLSQLGEQAERSQIARAEAAVQAQDIIDAHVKNFCRWWEQRGNAPVVHTLREQSEILRQQETAAAAARLQRGEDPQTVLDEFSRRLTGKLLHKHTAQTLKQPPPAKK